MSLALELPGFAAPRTRHGFFGRKGGVSTGSFASLNCGRGTNDPHVMKNREIVATTMGATAKDIVTVYQIHSADCIYVSEPVALDDRPQADAMITDVPGLVLGIITADCGPVLLHGIKANGIPIIGAAHAGWKGAVGGVLENTVKMMVDHGAVLNTIVAAVGPCIAQKSYEVSMGFEQPFLALDWADERFFREITLPLSGGGRGGGDRDGDSHPLRPAAQDTSPFQGEEKIRKLLFDLPGYIAKRLAAAGVSRVILSDVDTCSSIDDYYSYRRATREGRTDDGRQISCISIDKDP